MRCGRVHGAGGHDPRMLAGFDLELTGCPHPPPERESFIGNPFVILVMIRWTGLALWEFEFPFRGSLTSALSQLLLLFVLVESILSENLLIIYPRISLIECIKCCLSCQRKVLHTCFTVTRIQLYTAFCSIQVIGADGHHVGRLRGARLKFDRQLFQPLPLRTVYRSPLWILSTVGPLGFCLP